MVRIAISGKMGHGKDTFATLLGKYMKNIKQYAFATKVKTIVAEMTDTSLEDNSCSVGKGTIVPIFEKTLGQLQQEVGTKLREIDQNIWIKSLMATKGFLEEIKEEGVAAAVVVITDVRFKNEFLFCRENNFILIRVTRESTNHHSRLDGRDKEHISETDLDEYYSQNKFDLVIKNDFDLEHLEKLVISFVEEQRVKERERSVYNISCSK